MKIQEQINKQENESSLLTFDGLVSRLKSTFATLPDLRQGKNTSYSISDAAMSAFSVFFTQSPSFLSYQNQMQETKGQNNAASLFQIDKIPSDQQIRNMLDPISPGNFADVFDWSFDFMCQQGFIEDYRSINNTLLIALDGVCYHSSEAVTCDKCFKRKRKDGTVHYSHSAITPVLVAPGNQHVISLMPEFITPQDGHDKQDSEHAATKRWLKRNADKIKKLDITFLGDDLYDCQPICEAMLSHGCHFLLTCKPDSHKTLYEWVDELSALNKVNVVTVQRRRGKKTYTDTYRFTNKVPIRDGEDALYVNWCELVTTDKNGKTVYRNAYVTDHQITEDNVADMVQAGRARWKIENENNNTLKTKGYHLAHNFGHGEQYLSQTLLTLNLIAFLFHTILHHIDVAYKLVREKLPSRKTFFDDIRALTRYMYFQTWQHMLQFMMQGLEIEPPDSG